jgi:hypothetical protein
VVKAWAAALVLVALLAGCSWSRSQRMLPVDAGAEVMYVALGDSTVEGIGASAPSRNYVSRIHARLREWSTWASPARPLRTSWPASSTARCS